jgi:hypothetical protein
MWKIVIQINFLSFEFEFEVAARYWLHCHGGDVGARRVRVVQPCAAFSAG